MGGESFVYAAYEDDETTVPSDSYLTWLGYMSATFKVYYARPEDTFVLSVVWATDCR